MDTLKRKASLGLPVVALVTILTIALAVVPNSSPVEAGTPTNPVAYKYITDVTPVSDGVQLTLSWEGIKYGWTPSGLGRLADWTIQEYERQSRKAWPYHLRSRNSVASEIKWHCWAAATPAWRKIFPINIGFTEGYWD